MYTWPLTLLGLEYDAAGLSWFEDPNPHLRILYSPLSLFVLPLSSPLTKLVPISQSPQKACPTLSNPLLSLCTLYMCILLLDRRGPHHVVVGITSTYEVRQCMSPLKLWVRFPLMARCTRHHYSLALNARCTRYNFMW